eukprot:g75811.t1
MLGRIRCSVRVLLRRFSAPRRDQDATTETPVIRSRHTKKQAVERRRHGKTEAAIQADPDSQDVQAEPDLQDAQGNPELQAAGVPVAPDPAVFADRYDCVDEVEQSALDAGVSEAEVGVEWQPIFAGGRLREATVVDLLMEHATAHNISREGMQGFVNSLNLLILDGGGTKRVLKKWATYDKAMTRAAKQATSKYIVCPRQCRTGCMPLEEGRVRFCSGC